MFITLWSKKKNGCHFADDICKCIFFNEENWISTDIPLKYVPNDPIDYKSALVLVMACHLLGLTVTWTNVDRDLWHHIWHLLATLIYTEDHLKPVASFNPQTPGIISCNYKFVTFMPTAFPKRKHTRWMPHDLIGHKSAWGLGTEPIPESILTKFHGAVWFTRV